jgi:protein-tyrosine phosphatase
VPDPYTGGPEDFRQVWRLVDSAAQAVVARLSTA